MAQTLASTPKADREWKIRSAADALMEAEAIKRDKPLLNAARAELKKRQSDLKKVVAKI